MVAVLRYWILLLLGTSCLGHAELSTRLSSDSIEELESVRLVIRDHGAQQTETLDLTELQNDFHIMGNNTRKQYKYFNGRTQSWVDYQITLQPKRTG
ncbi:MAG: BatD family protein, partial [Pseudomonadota bacterium]|nr:BatD family protein [Pseudomonadota bacterium]